MRLFGLVPGLGDIAGALVAVYALRVARQLNAPAAIQLHMLSNIALDALVGMVPIVGDLFDFAFKAQTRNLALLEAHVAMPAKAARRSRRGLLLMALAIDHRVRDADRARRLDALSPVPLARWRLPSRIVVRPSPRRPARSRSRASRCRCRRARRRARSSSRRWVRCPPCRRSAMSTSDSRPSDSGQSRPCSSRCSARPSGVRKRARPPRSCRSTWSMGLRGALSFEDAQEMPQENSRASSRSTWGKPAISSASSSPCKVRRRFRYQNRPSPITTR